MEERTDHVGLGAGASAAGAEGPGPGSSVGSVSSHEASTVFCRVSEVRV